MRERSLGKAASAGSQNQRQSSVQSVTELREGGGLALHVEEDGEGTADEHATSYEMSACSLYK